MMKIKTKEAREERAKKEEVQVQQADRKQQEELQIEKDQKHFKVSTNYPIDKADRQVLD